MAAAVSALLVLVHPSAFWVQIIASEGHVLLGMSKCHSDIEAFGLQVVNRLRHSFVHATIKEYGVQYDKTWIYDKIHHEINQFCSSHSLQEVYIDKFDQVGAIKCF